MEDIVLSLGERTPRFDLDVVPFEKLLCFNLLMERVRFDLIDGWHDLVMYDEIHYAVRMKVAESDRSDTAFTIQIFHRTPRTVNVTVGLMDKIKVEIVELKAFH